MNLHQFFMGRAIVLTILLVIGLLVGAFYWLNNYIYQAKQAGPSEEMQEFVVPDTRLRASFTPPAGWAVLDTYPNGVSYKSPDFGSRFVFGDISSGSALTVSNQGESPWSLEELPAAMTDLNSDDTVRDVRFFKVDGYEAVEFLHSYGENNNNHRVVAILYEGNLYQIEQQYKKSSSNPHPRVVDNVLASWEFTD